MQKLMLLTVYLFALLTLPAAPVKLNDAVMKQKVTCYIHGNAASTHYLEPVVVELTNKSNESINVAIENGDMFIPADAAKQNIVVTSPLVVALQPGQKAELKVKGMCTEQSDAAGNEQTIYSYQPGNNDTLRKLAAFISEKQYQTSAAQYAVWSLMDKGDLNGIFAADTAEENNLKRFMAKLTGKTFALTNKDYRTSYYAPPKERVGGNFEYSFTKAQDIQIAMFDANGILVRELFNQKKVPAGTHKLNFEYDSSVYTDDIYYFKLIVGNEVMVNRKWDAGAMREHFKQQLQNRD